MRRRSWPAAAVLPVLLALASASARDNASATPSNTTDDVSVRPPPADLRAANATLPAGDAADDAANHTAPSRLRAARARLRQAARAVGGSARNATRPVAARARSFYADRLAPSVSRTAARAAARTAESARGARSRLSDGLGGLRRAALEAMARRWRAMVAAVAGAPRTLRERAMRAVRAALATARRRCDEARRSWRSWLRRDRQVSRILRESSAGRWYRLLRVRRRASKPKLREAYRRIAKRVHPDKTRDERAAEAFKALRDAFELLSDGERRARYDEQLAADDVREQELARRRRAVAAGVARRLGAEGWELAMEHKRVTAGIVALLVLRFIV